MVYLKGRSLRSGFILAALTLLAVGGNYFSVTQFFGIDFLFGSIAVLMVVCLYGVFWGTAVAFIASIYSYQLWGHPYAILIFSLEALLVGLWVRKGRKNLPLLDGLFWLILGMPAVWFFYHHVMQMDLTATGLIMLKQSVNGVFNALIASLCLKSVWIRVQRGDKEHISLQETVFDLMVALVLFPALIIMTLNSRTAMTEIKNRILRRTEELSTDISNHLRFWHRHHLHGVMELARLAGRTEMVPSEELQNYTKLIKRAHSDFHNMYVADAQGTTIAFFPSVNQKGELTIGLNFSDRPYYTELKETKRPVLSKVFMGRGGVITPIVTVSVPVLTGERFRGFALAAVDLKGIRTMLTPYAKNGATTITLVDTGGYVIASTLSDRRAMQLFEQRKTGVTVAVSPSVDHWFPGNPSLPEMMRWKDSYFVHECDIDEAVPWRLVIEVSVAPAQRQLYLIYVKNLAIMAAFAGIGFALAALFSRWIVRPLSRLSSVTTDLPDKLLTRQDIDWPESSAREIHLLVENFQAMVRILKQTIEKLQTQSRDLERSNAELETEIRERKSAQAALTESEERYRQFFQENLSGAYIMKPDGLLVACNPAFLKMFGFSSTESALQVDFESFNPDGFFTPAFLERLKKEKRIIQMQAKRFKPDGSTLHVIENAVGVFDSDGQLIEVKGFIMDVSDQRKLELRLRHALKMEAVGTLAGGIAHQFNNLLMAINGNASLMLHDIGPSHPHYKKLNIIADQVKSGARLTAQLLGYARKGRYEIKPVNLNRLIEMTSISFGQNRKTIRIHRELSEDLPPVQVDQAQIEQVLFHCYANAADAMPDGGDLFIQTSATTHEQMKGKMYDPKPGDYVRVRIQDTGTGMDPDTLEKIFDPFFTTKELGKGVGLGLSSGYGIIKGHGGYIDVDSEKNSGTAFSIYLPVAKEKRLVRRRVAETCVGERQTILLVDDEEMIIDVGQQMLDKLGFGVYLARGGLEAIEIFKKNSDDIDLVILDMVMPGIGGGEVYDRIKRINPRVKVLLSSGYTIDGQAAEILARGCDGFIPKPFNLKKLAGEIRKILGAPPVPAG